MLTTLDLVRLQARVYQQAQAGWWSRESLEETSEAPWAWASLSQPGSDLLFLRGSVTLLDWFEDVRSQKAVMDGRLGPIPAGFAYGLDTCAKGLTELVNPIIVGHSLGAARAALLAGLRLWQRLPVRALVLFGSPRPGAAPLSKLLRQIPFFRSFRNLADRVCEVPLASGGWEQPIGLTELGTLPTMAHLTLDLLADHHIDLYIAALATERLEYVQ